VKLHFHDDVPVTVMVVSRSIEYESLVKRFRGKARRCRIPLDDGPLHMKYMDEDGDIVSLISTEDIHLAFEQGSQITLFVT
jgi:cell division control protein 24